MPVDEDEADVANNSVERTARQFDVGECDRGGDLHVGAIDVDVLRGRLVDHEASIAVDAVEAVEQLIDHEPVGTSSETQVRAVTRPPELLEPLERGDVDRVEVNVPKGAQQLNVGRDDDRVKAAAEQRAVSTMAIVEASAVGRAEQVHEIRHLFGAISDEQMEVIAHQGIRVNLHIRPFASSPSTSPNPIRSRSSR